MRRKLLIAKDLESKDFETLLKSTKQHLKLNKVKYKILSHENEIYLQILPGDGSSPVERMARFLQKKYDTILVIDPMLTIESKSLGFFNYYDETPAIFMRPADLIHMGRDDYSTLLHEARHARYEYMANTGKESIFHTEFIDTNDGNAFRLANEKIDDFYQAYMSFEELPNYVVDLQRNVYEFARKRKPLLLDDILDLSDDVADINLLATRSKSWLKKFRTKLNDDGWEDLLKLGFDEREIYISFKLDDLEFTARFYDTFVIDELVQLNYQQMERKSKRLLTQRMNKLDDFLNSLQDTTSEMQTTLGLRELEEISEEEFFKRMRQSYKKIKNKINIENKIEKE